jgi:hypothetical protein
MADEAQRGLDWRREFGRGGTEVGIARARDISNKVDLSMDTVQRMASYFARHEVDKEAEGFRPGEDGYPSNGRIAWALWGGDPGQSWANGILESENDERIEKRPYPGEHAARLQDPDKYDGFARENDAGGEGVDFIYGTLPDGGTELQAIRFDADEFTVEQAKKWLADNGFEPIEFEPATGSSERSQMVIQSPEQTGLNMSEKEIRRGVPVEIREDETGEIKVSGYAAVFGEETNIGGMFTEMIERGAFKAAIKRDDVVFLINHEGLPLARTRSGTLTLKEDQRGLYMEAMLDQSDPDVRSIVPKMKRGDLDKMSFAFRPVRQKWDDRANPPRRTIQEAQLFDVSIVTTPAYDGTEIALRSLQEHREAKAKSQAARRMRMKATLAGIESRNEYLVPPEPQPEIVSGSVNAINTQNAIDNWNLGPEAASDEPGANQEYWAKMADVWSINEAEARRQLCANCEHFNNTPEMLKAMEDIPRNDFDTNAGGRGWCEKLEFICHNLRSCQAWERKDFEAEE